MKPLSTSYQERTVYVDGWYTELFYAILFPFSFAHYMSLHLALVPVDELCIMHDLQWSGIACRVLIGGTSSEPCGNTVHCPAALL